MDISCTLSRKLCGRRIVLGVTGSIAAVETVKLARLLIRHGAEVFPVMSDAAQDIIHPYALEFATGRMPITKLTGAVEHVSLCGETPMRADLLLIAPATANTISKIAQGVDDTTVTTFATTAIGSEIPVMIVPAMHGTMFKHPIVMKNLKDLEKIGVKVVGPRISEKSAKIAGAEEIVGEVLRTLSISPLMGKKVLVVTGASQEPIDDMRVITNRSSGTMGMMIAEEAYALGADLTVWHGPTVDVPRYWKSKRFSSASDLLGFLKKLRRVDVAIMPAAIGDFAPKKRKGKIPSGKTVKIELRPTPKIIHGLRSKTKILVGFKAESGVSRKELEKRATGRLKKSRADLFVANDLRKVKHDTTEIIVIGREGVVSEVEGSKVAAAREVLRRIESLL